MIKVYEFNGNTHIEEGGITMVVNATLQEVEENIELYQQKINNLKENL